MLTSQEFDLLSMCPNNRNLEAGEFDQRNIQQGQQRLLCKNEGLTSNAIRQLLSPEYIDLKTEKNPSNWKLAPIIPKKIEVNRVGVVFLASGLCQNPKSRDELITSQTSTT